MTDLHQKEIDMRGTTYEYRVRDDVEFWCDRCKRRHGLVWSAPNDLWNAVMRGGVKGNPDEFSLCCPTCFMQLADERDAGTGVWLVVTRNNYPYVRSEVEDALKCLRAGADVDHVIYHLEGALGAIGNGEA